MKLVSLWHFLSFVRGCGWVWVLPACVSVHIVCGWCKQKRYPWTWVIANCEPLCVWWGQKLGFSANQQVFLISSLLWWHLQTYMTLCFVFAHPAPLLCPVPSLAGPLPSSIPLLLSRYIYSIVLLFPSLLPLYSFISELPFLFQVPHAVWRLRIGHFYAETQRILITCSWGHKVTRITRMYSESTGDQVSLTPPHRPSSLRKMIYWW